MRNLWLRVNPTSKLCHRARLSLFDEEHTTCVRYTGSYLEVRSASIVCREKTLRVIHDNERV